MQQPVAAISKHNKELPNAFGKLPFFILLFPLIIMFLFIFGVILFALNRYGFSGIPCRHRKVDLGTLFP
jgi:hypothetical protein